jgi:PEP-CTERM motif
MIRVTTLAMLLLCVCALLNAGQINYPLDQANSLQARTASDMRDLMGLVTTGADGGAYVPLETQANVSSKIAKSAALPLAIVVPEPSSYLLLGAGLILFGAVRRRLRA